MPINPNAKSTINLGHQGEYGVTDIEFDVASFPEDSEFSLLHMRPGENTYYSVPTVQGATFDWFEVADYTLTWHVGQKATEIAGSGKVEIRATGTGFLDKSSEMTTTVESCSFTTASE